MFKNIFKLVMPFFFLMLIAFSQNSYAQLSGSYTIPGAPFATVKSAFDSLNLVGVGSGGVTFNVTAGYTETTTDSLVLTATGTISNPIVFQTAGGGANPKMTRTDAGSKTTSTLGGQGDAVITIQGSDYVTFNGIDVAADLATVEYGYYLRKVDGTDGCKYVTIKNAVIDMTKATSQYVVGIYSSNLIPGSPLNSATGVTVTSSGGRNEYVTITGNTIQDVFSTIVLRGFNHTTAPYDFYDQNFVVGQNGAGNILQNYAGNAAQSAYGVYAIYHNNLDVSYNTINNTANGGSNFTSTGYGIFHSTSSAANGTFNNNIFNLSATTGQLRAITAGATGIGTIIANNNTILLFQAGTTEASGIVVQSLSNGSTVTMNYNTISYGGFASTSQSNMFANFGNAVNFSFVGNQNNGVVNKTGASGNLYCLNGGGSSPNANEIIADNTFDSITVAGSSTLYGIHVSTASTATRQAYNNIVSNFTGGTGTTYGLSFQTSLSQQVYNNTVRDITAGGTTYGLYFSGNNPTVYNNNVYNITTANQTLIGIYDGGSQTTNCYKNQVYNLTSNYSGASTMTVCGIQILSGTVGNYVYNNFISDIKVPNATVTNNALFGINASASGATTKIRLYYNTIYLNSTGTGYKSYGIFSHSGHDAELRNNIVVNTSGGNSVAYGRSSANFGTYSIVSDNNDFYAPNIFHDGTTYYTTLDSYKALVYPKDQASFSENPPFINTTTAPYDLHLNTGFATQTERGGRPVITPVVIADDFDGNTRDASFSDVGADEFAGTVLDLTAPIIAYTPFANTSSLSDRTLIVNVSDQAGVPATAPGWPNLYWKKGILGTYTTVQPTSVAGSDYTFNFGSGVVPGDTVYYYLVARDTVATTPNLRAFPTLGAGNFTFDPPAVGIPPTSPYSYQVTSSSLAGDYTVGTALFNQVTGKNITFEKSGDKWLPMENGQRYYGDLYVKKIEHPEFNYPDGTDGIYLTLTAAIADLNVRGVSSAVNFLLTDASYTTASGEIFPYVVNITNEFKPTATNKVTIKPNTGVTSLIQGASTNTGIFEIFSNYVNINGSNSGGTDRSLTIENSSASFPMVVLIGSIGTTPRTGNSLKNSIIINGTNSPSTASTPAVILSDSTVSPSAFTYTSGYFSNIAIQNNRIQKSSFGIQAYGVAGSGNGNGLLIDSNIMTDTSANSIGLIGIQIFGVDGATVTNNNIGNLVTPVSGGVLPGGISIGSQTINSTISNNIIGPINITSASSGPVGISINSGNANSNLIISNNTISGLKINQAVVLNGITIGGLTGNVLITKNRIYDIKNSYISATSAYGAYAIFLGSSLTAANITLANNFIWDIAAYGRANLTFHNGYGVYISAGGGYNLYHNTISLTTEQTLATGLPACINISSSITTPASLDIRNNIFANYQTIGTDRYAIICNAANTVFANIDNNDYYTTGPNLGYLGSNRADLTAWQTATGKDANSISGDPKFVDSTDLHIDPNYNFVDGKGFYLATVPQDIDGDTRNNPSDIGADEYTFTPPADPTNVLANALNDAMIEVAFTLNPDSNNVVIVWNTTGIFTTPSGTPPAVDSAFAGGTVLYNDIYSPVYHFGLTPSTVYYYKLFSYNGINYSSGIAVSDTTLAVENPSSVNATALSDTRIIIEYQPNSNYQNVVIVWNLTGVFTTPNGTPPPVDSAFAGGTLLFNGLGSPVSHNGLTPLTTYYYKIFSHNGTGYYSSGVEVSASAIQPLPAESFAYNGGLGSYGKVNLSTGAFTTLAFRPQGDSRSPVTADNDTTDSQYAVMADFSFPPNYTLWHVNFRTFSADSTAPVGPLASGQNLIKGMAYNKVTDTWYVVSGNDIGTAAYLYTLNITTGVLTTVGQIQNANLPVGIAINCNGNAYVVNIVSGVSNTAVLHSLNLSTAVATAIGTDLGLANVTGFNQDMDFNPDNGNLYWSGVYSGGFFELGSFRLVNVIAGTSTEISSSGPYEFITGFNVNGICASVTTFQLSVNVTNGWNMVSIPGLHPVDQNVNTWWQYRDLGADVFKYLGGYQVVTNATPGTGYWMKHSGDRTYNTGEEWPVGGIQIVTHDPLTAVSGWNLIGGYELSVATSGVTTNPPGLQSGPIYKYAAGYQVATTLDPGYGYWIKLDAGGQIIIPETMAKGEAVEYFPENWGKISITDATGINYTLYAVKGEVNLDDYELPPAPMAGMFDIRYSSGRIAEDINSSVKTIDMNGVTYPLTIRVEGMDIRLMDETGKTVNVNLKKGGDFVISDVTIQKLMVSGDLIPAVYALEQNYPNPFNPSTVIEFSLPENVGNVQLSIYNALGEKVAELVNTALTAGKYQYQWNASNVATGMYIYELRTDNFVSVKKMMLLK